MSKEMEHWFMGYIDHQCGLTYEILACAKQNESGSIEVFQGNDFVFIGET